MRLSNEYSKYVEVGELNPSQEIRQGKPKEESSKEEEK